MKTTDLPTAVTAYFDVIDGPHRSAAIELFAPGAQVTDDGQVHRGRDEIVGWLTGEAGRYTITYTFLAASRTERGATVDVRVEGDFPGGRVDLRQVFTLDGDGLIEGLSIAP